MTDLFQRLNLTNTIIAIIVGLVTIAGAVAVRKRAHGERGTKLAPGAAARWIKRRS